MEFKKGDMIIAFDNVPYIIETVYDDNVMTTAISGYRKMNNYAHANIFIDKFQIETVLRLNKLGGYDLFKEAL